MSTSLLSAADSAALDSYAFEQCVEDQEVIFARMTLRASEVRARIRALDPSGRTRREPLILFADTFVWDDIRLASPAVSIVARVIHIGQQGAAGIFLPEEADRGLAMLEILHQQVTGNPLKIISRTVPDEVWTLPPVDPKCTAQVIACSDQAAATKTVGTTTTTTPRKFEVEVTSLPVRISEVATNPHVWNILKAQFAAASTLMDEAASRPTALRMLEWIVACSQAIALRENDYSAEACQLNFQASSLLLLSSAPAGIRSVPVWSKEHLQRRIEDQLSILAAYETKIRAIEARQDIQGALDAVSSALKEIAEADESALLTSIETNEQEIKALWDQYHALNWTFELQTYDISLALSRFQLGLKQAAVVSQTMAILQLVGAVVQFAAAAYGVSYPDPKATAAAAEAAAKAAAEKGDAFQGEINNVFQLVWAVYGDEMIAAVKGLKAYFEKIMVVGKAAGEAAKFAQMLNVSSTMTDRGAFAAIPELAEMAALDPEADWNIFAIKAEVMMREFIEDRKGTGSISGAKEYYLSLRALAEYGRALNLKAVALARAQSRSLELAAQRQALRFAAARWKRLQSEARSAEEKLSLGKALLTEACLNTKRSILVLTEGYRSAYLYNQLTSPDLKTRLTMDHAALLKAYLGIKPGMDNFFATPLFPQTHDPDPFEFTIVAAGATVPAGTTGPTATLHTPVGAPPFLAWTMPIVHPPFEAGLSRGRYSAYFVEEAWFFLLGAKPDASNVINLRVSTSGNYENGYGATGPNPTPPQRFLTRGHDLDFTYKPLENNRVLTPWKPVGRTKDNYLSPSPFTSWKAVIERAGDLKDLRALQVKLVLTYQNAATPVPPTP